jgi:hypothetical protein
LRQNGTLPQMRDPLNPSGLNWRNYLNLSFVVIYVSLYVPN